MSATTIVTLAWQHSAAFHRRVERVGFVERLSEIQSWLSLRWSRVTLGALLRRDAAFLADQALWHRGAAASIDRLDRTESLDGSFAITDRVRDMEQRIQRLRERLLEMQNRLQADRHSASAQVLAQAVGEWSASAADCYEGLREFRGAIQAHQADFNSISRAGRRGAASTAAELDAQLSGAADPS